MTTKVTFPNVEFPAPSATAIRVLLGETFTMQLEGDVLPVWATVNDASLELTEVSADTVRVKASEVGQAEVQVQVNRQVQYFLAIEVYSNEAARLNASAGAAELK